MSLRDRPAKNLLMAQVDTVECAERRNDSGSSGNSITEIVNLYGSTLRGSAIDGGLRAQNPDSNWRIHRR